MKRLIKVFLAVSIVALGVFCGQSEADKVQAATLAEDGYAVLTSEEYSWSDTEKANHNAPVATAEGYTTWLFAGWFSDEACTTPIEDINQVGDASYAKFVQPDTLSVMAQVSTDGNKIRFVSSVDSLDYESAGFTIEGVGTNKTTKVFQRIATTTTGDEYEFSPKVIGSQSEYFITAKLSISDATKDYVVKAFWTTYDGTVVYGASRCVSASDNAVNVINIPLEGELNNSKTYTATLLRADETTLVSDLNVAVTAVASNVRITLSDGVADKNSLQSATKIVIYDESSTSVEEYIYRNYFASYTVSETANADGTYTITGDTSWYDIDPNATEFVIASVADLYGLATLVDDGTKFADNTVTLIRNIEVNEGTAVSAVVNEDGSIATAAYWQSDDGRKYIWNPIGDDDTFQGEFDGDHNTISGLYYSSTAEESYVGLFATLKDGILKNVRVTNSYFASSGAFLGGIVGYSQATKSTGESILQNLYSDVILVSTNNYVGGITGRVRYNNTIQECWFAGEIYVSGSANYIGGIAGDAQGNPTAATFDDCLNTGYINSLCESEECILGGVLSQLSSKNVTVELHNCLVMGQIDVKLTTNMGAFVGSTTLLSGATCDRNTCYVVDFITEQGAGVSCTPEEVKSQDEFSTTSLTTLFTDASAWVRTESSGFPILKVFAEWWAEENAQ